MDSLQRKKQSSLEINAGNTNQTIRSVASAIRVLLSNCKFTILNSFFFQSLPMGERQATEFHPPLLDVPTIQECETGH